MLCSQSLYKEIIQLTDCRQFLIAYSGGLDSHVLLDMMASLRSQYPDVQLRAIHIHHGLSPNADDWLEHCRNICETLQVPFVFEKVQLQNNAGDSIEALAREARYDAIAKHILSDECLLTAHTEDDQAETVLLQLLRGSGPKGLAAMPVKKTFANHFLLRPFLNYSRADLQQYAMHRSLSWIEDDSNKDTRFDRNFLRHDVISLLAKRWPSVTKNLARVAAHNAEADDLLSQLAELDFAHVMAEKKNKLNIPALLQLPANRQRNVLRYWICLNKALLPDTKKMRLIQTELLQARPDANPQIQWGNHVLRRHREVLYLQPVTNSFNRHQEFVWDLSSEMTLPDGMGKLTVCPTLGKGIRKQICNEPITVRFRQGGESIRPVGKSMTRPLKKLFQEWGVPTWLRERVPLIYAGEQLIAVADFCVSDSVAVNTDEPGLSILFSPM